MKVVSREATPRGESLGFRQHFAYALPVGAASILYGGPLVILQGIYAKHHGISLVAIASVLLIARLFDTVTDPIIGYWSDRYHSHAGSRKPFIFWGGLLFIVSAYFLFSPVGSVNLFYFSGWLLGLYLGYTIFSVPHYAWGSELCYDSQSSTRIFTLRAVMMGAGSLTFYSLPQLPFFESTEFTPEVLHWAVVATVGLLLPSLFFCLRYVPTTYLSSQHSKSCRYHSPPVDAPEEKVKTSSSLLALWGNIRHNKPFLVFLSAFLLWGIGLGSWVGLLYIFIDSYLAMGEHFSIVAFIGVGGSLVLVPVFSRLARSQGKIAAWIVSSLLTAFSILFMGFLEPQKSSISDLAIVMTLAYLGSMSFMIFAPALLSDIIDYGTWKNNSQFSGSYFSLFLLASKFNEAIGIALGLAVAGAFGFEPNHAEHSENAVRGLKLAGVWLPALLLMLSIAIISHIPINTHRHAIICKALARREKRAAPL